MRKIIFSASSLTIMFCIVMLFLTGCSIPGGQTSNTDNRDLKRKLIPSGLNKSVGTGGKYSWYTGPFYDESGRVEITIFEDYTFGQHNTVSVTVPEEYVMIGGGAQVDFGGGPGPGAFLTGSWPSADRNLRTWNAQSKDHVVADKHFLYVEAIGMKLMSDDGVNYVSPDEIKKHMIIHFSRSARESSSTTYQTASVYEAGNNFDVLSGGARVLDPFNIGKLLSKSTFYFGLGNGWSASAISCFTQSYNSVMAYAIYIDKNDIAGFGRLTNTSTHNTKSASSNNTCKVYADAYPGFVISGIEGESYAGTWGVINGGHGRFMYAISPLHLDGTYGGYVANKDHFYLCAEEKLEISVISIKKM